MRPGVPCPIPAKEDQRSRIISSVSGSNIHIVQFPVYAGLLFSYYCGGKSHEVICGGVVVSRVDRINKSRL